MQRRVLVTGAVVVLLAAWAMADEVEAQAGTSEESISLEEEIEAVRQEHPEVHIDKLDVNDDDEDEDDRNHGGAFNLQVLALDDNLMSYVSKYSGDVAQHHLDLDDRVLFMIGGMTWGEADRGLRIGSGTWVGYKTYRSDEYTVSFTDTVTGDTGSAGLVTSLRVIPAMVGGTLEKSWTFGPLGLFAGGMLGGGAFVVIKQTSRAGSIFTDISYEDREDLQEGVSAAVAPFIAGDIHAGATVRLTDGLHLGAEFVTLVTYAPEGFVTGAAVQDFFTVSPGGRLRLQFGGGR